MRNTYITGGASTAVQFANQLKVLEEDIKKKNSPRQQFGSKYLHVPMSSLDAAGSPSQGSVGSGGRTDSPGAGSALAKAGRRLFESPSSDGAPRRSMNVTFSMPDGCDSSPDTVEGKQRRPSNSRKRWHMPITFDALSDVVDGGDDELLSSSFDAANGLRPPTSMHVQTGWRSSRSCPAGSSRRSKLSGDAADAGHENSASVGDGTLTPVARDKSVAALSSVGAVDVTMSPIVTEQRRSVIAKRGGGVSPISGLEQYSASGGIDAGFAPRAMILPAKAAHHASSSAAVTASPSPSLVTGFHYAFPSTSGGPTDPHTSSGATVGDASGGALQESPHRIVAAPQGSPFAHKSQPKRVQAIAVSSSSAGT